jgi:hypothetical protein
VKASILPYGAQGGQRLFEVLLITISPHPIVRFMSAVDAGGGQFLPVAPGMCYSGLGDILKALSTMAAAVRSLRHAKVS